MSYIWKILSKDKFLNQETETISEILLKNRKLKNPREIRDFFNPSLEKFLSSKISGIKEGVKRVLDAKDMGEKVIVFSDYDADGLCACAILWETLFDLKINALPYVPDRVKEGYGLNRQAIKNLAEDGAKLIITVDHGITAYEEVEFAKKLGVDILVTDHHEKPKKIPKPCALIHTTEICGAGVAFRFAYEIAKELNFEKEVLEKLQLAAIATIADLVPLIGDNRAIVKFGLEKLKRTRRAGILALLSKLNLPLGRINEKDISHILVPRLNATGRIESAIFSLRLLCTKNPIHARELAEKLFATNVTRQEMVSKAILEAKEMPYGEGPIGFLKSGHWHEGIIGLIASRMVEEAGKPMIIISQGEKFSKGSARSVESINIIETLRIFSDILTDVGGHPMAAGFTIETSNISLLQSKISQLPGLALEKEKRVLEIECELDLAKINLKFWEELQKFAPFGVGNPEPLFATKGAFVEDLKLVGQDKTHLKMVVEGFGAIAFGQAKNIEELHPSQKIDLVYTIDLDTFANRKSLQLKVKDFRLSEN